MDDNWYILVTTLLKASWRYVRHHAHRRDEPVKHRLDAFGVLILSFAAATRVGSRAI
jgi:hypothetical protein